MTGDGVNDVVLSEVRKRNRHGERVRQHCGACPRVMYPGPEEHYDEQRKS
jgi:hypothetical protein